VLLNELQSRSVALDQLYLKLPHSVLRVTAQYSTNAGRLCALLISTALRSMLFALNKAHLQQCVVCEECSTLCESMRMHALRLVVNCDEHIVNFSAVMRVH
jgi:hypothetical protein